MNFFVDALPTTVNHSHFHVNNRRILKPEVHAYRKLVGVALGPKRMTWRPTGAVGAVIFFESPNWVTKKLEIREVDVDNRIKPLFDAIKELTGVPDETNWQFSVFKIASKKTRTLVYLFDLGDVVEIYA